MPDQGRQGSYIIATMDAANGSQPKTPVSTFVGDSHRFVSQDDIRNESGNYESWSFGASFSSAEVPNILSTPLVREVFTPKLLDINYVEGVSDTRWKSRDFPWTKKLEVLIP